MKTRTLLVVLLFGILTALAQLPPSPLRIISFTRGDATLSWTNEILANVPVYGVLRSPTVTGTWQHVFFVTTAYTGISGFAFESDSSGSTPIGTFIAVRTQ